MSLWSKKCVESPLASMCWELATVVRTVPLGSVRLKTRSDR